MGRERVVSLPWPWEAPLGPQLRSKVCSLAPPGRQEAMFWQTFRDVLSSLGSQMLPGVFFWRVRPFRITLPPQREHNFVHIGVFENTSHGVAPGAHLETQNGSELVLARPESGD